MNKVVLMGRLTKDPTIRYSQGEKPMAISDYTLAVDRRGKKDEADFIRIKGFGKSAEFAEKYLRKGTKVIVTGHIQTGSYDDKKTGQKVYTTDVIAEDQEFAESKAASMTEPTEDQKTDKDGFMSIPDGIDEELPFM
jgi:single-strand DNA-binding protein